MPLLTVRNLTVTHGGPPVLHEIDLRIDAGERVCLIGRNGCGKTTLLRAIAGLEEPDRGEVEIAPGTRIGYLPQQVQGDLEGAVFDVVAAGLGAAGDRLAAYHAASHDLAEDPGNGALLARLERLQRELEAGGGWEQHRRVEKAVARFGLDPDAEAATLSAGRKRRTLMARALVAEPDLLLLDEPTNHLDLEAIADVEDFLRGYGGALLFVTHDRVLLQRVATRILDLDRGRLRSFACDYNSYRERKQAVLDDERKHQAAFEKKLAEEETWIRQGVRERRTRNEGRVRRLIEMRTERRARRERVGKARLTAEEAARSGKRVIRTEGLTFGYDATPVVRDLSTTIWRGDKVGIIGANGSGKTTLLRLLLGELEPDAGTLEHGTKLEIAYFDQLHAQLDEAKTVAHNVADGNDTVERDGRRIHVMGYLRTFLFTPDRAQAPVATLSGGERNRLLLARMFTRPANVLVLDEPTNDLDVETLELLELLLVEFSGTVLLVSHDRALLENVITQSLVFEGDGRIREYSGGYDDWMKAREARAKKPSAPKKAAAAPPPADRPRRLNWQEKQELAELPEKIEALESGIAAQHEAMSDPAFFRQDGSTIADARAALRATETELAEAYARWESLEERA